MLRYFVCFSILACFATSAFAEPPAPLDDRATILEVELSRTGAARLAPYLTPDAHPLSRWYAIRALGRMGEHSGAPAVLKGLLEAGTPDLVDVLWSAGICQSKELGEAIAAHLAHDDEAVVVAAAKALGWSGWLGAPTRLAGLLLDKRPGVRAAALIGLARTRADTLLERCMRFVNDPDEGVVDAALYACWLMAAVRSGKAKAADDSWDGDADLARLVMPMLIDARAERRMGALRILGALLPKKLDAIPSALAKRAEDADPRVTQDYVWRILTRREGPLVDGALRALLGHADPKVQQLAVEALAKREGDDNKQALHKAYADSKDWRLRAELAVALAHHGDRQPLRDISTTRPPRGTDIAIFDALRFRGAAMLPDEDAVSVVINAGAPHLLDGDSLEGAAWFACFDALDGKEDARISPWLTLVLGKCRAQGKHYIYGAGLVLAGSSGYYDLLVRHLKPATSRVVELHTEAVLGLIGGLEKALQGEDVPEGFQEVARVFLAAVVEKHPSNFAKEKAFDVAEAASKRGLALEGVPAPKGAGLNDWKGLPRPEGEFLGKTWKGEGPWLTAREIAQMAAMLHEAGEELSAARIRFETTQGVVVVELATDEAPVHAVNAALAARSGLWDGTRFHRVVPNFVIQGGDPYGHGAGSGGWTVPDEINRLRYVRGAVGMPKSRKDDGGCQVFVMHTEYRPLDERYTVYGKVTQGMDVVDNIRVGDRITKATLDIVGSEQK